MFHHQSAPIGLLTLLAVSVMPLSPASGQQSSGEGGWVSEHDKETGHLVRTMRMTLHPKGEPRPALEHQLLPGDFEMLDGNAATFYLSAMGFLEQQPARDRLSKFVSEAREKAQRDGEDVREAPPYGWLSLTPQQLPVDEVKEYLQLLSFQERFLAEAVRRRNYDLDRNLRDIDNPVGFLLPEIQAMRDLARNQSLRCKLAIAEGRTDDALAILGQQYAMARHVGQDEFLVSALVGIAITGVAWGDALHLVQRPETPNLYWAFASLPQPLVDVRHTLAVERHFFYLQFKPLREVDEQPRPAGYWQDFLDRLVPALRGLEKDVGLPSLPEEPEQARAVLAGAVAAAYPEAKRYLIEEWDMPSGQVEAYPTAQTVFLALVRYGDVVRDEQFKWSHLPPWQAREYLRQWEPEHADAEPLGWVAEMSLAMTPAIAAATEAFARSEQYLALLQTVEAIRMYAADHDGQLPATLDELPVPAAIDPATGEPLEYGLRDGEAILSGEPLANVQSRLILRISDDGQAEP